MKYTYVGVVFLVVTALPTMMYSQLVQDSSCVDSRYMITINSRMLTDYCNKLDCDNFDKVMNIYRSSGNISLSDVAKKNNDMALNMYQVNKDLQRAIGYAEKSIQAYNEKFV